MLQVTILSNRLQTDLFELLSHEFRGICMPGAASAPAVAGIVRQVARRGLKVFLIDCVERRVDLERQFLVDMATFVELEKIRGGESGGEDDGSVARREKRQNLSWLLGHYPGKKLIYWDGRGPAPQPDLPTDEQVFRVELVIEVDADE